MILLADARVRVGDIPGLTELLRYLGSESKLVLRFSLGTYWFTTHG